MKRIEDLPKNLQKIYNETWHTHQPIHGEFPIRAYIAELFFVAGYEAVLKEVRETRYQEGVREIEIKSSETLRKMPELFLTHTVSPSLTFMQTENKDSKAKRTIVQLISHNGDLRALTSDGRIYRLMEDEFGDESWVRDEDSISQE